MAGGEVAGSGVGARADVPRLNLIGLYLWTLVNDIRGPPKCLSQTNVPH